MVGLGGSIPKSGKWMRILFCPCSKMLDPTLASGLLFLKFWRKIRNCFKIIQEMSVYYWKAQFKALAEGGLNSSGPLHDRCHISSIFSSHLLQSWSPVSSVASHSFLEWWTMKRQRASAWNQQQSRKQRQDHNSVITYSTPLFLKNILNEQKQEYLFSFYHFIPVQRLVYE